jgi:putative SOS response-associated peptidase YedK
MPVVLAADEWARWLDCSAPVAANDPLFAPRLKSALIACPLSRGVNNARNKEPELLAPAGSPIRLDGASD